MKNDLSILLVEDIPSDAELIEREINRAGIECKICRVETKSDFLVSLTVFCPDVILSDFYLPTFNGLEALALTREHTPQTPFIMVAGTINEETAVDCMKAGAWDYVLKDRITRLSPAILAALEKKRTIDERNQALEALEKSRSFYLRLFETSPALIWRTDSQGNFDYFNQKWLEFTGHSADQDFAEILNEKPASRGQRPIPRRSSSIAHSAASSFESECRLRDQSGEYRRIQTFGRPFFDEQGIYGGHIGYCFDTTERFETEEVLRKLSRAVEQSTSAFLITDTNGCIEYANASFTRMTGYTLGRGNRSKCQPDRKG